MMSSKDYRAMAEILATSTTVQEIRERLAHWLACDNPRFDHDRFMTASAHRQSDV